MAEKLETNMQEALVAICFVIRVISVKQLIGWLTTEMCFHHDCGYMKPEIDGKMCRLWHDEWEVFLNKDGVTHGILSKGSVQIGKPQAAGGEMEPTSTSDACHFTVR